MRGGRPSRRTNKLVGALLALVVVGLVAVVLLVGAGLWWLAFRGPETSASTGVASRGTASIALAWDRSPDPNVTGYKILFGTQPGSYPNSVDAGSEASATLTNLENGTRYYIVTVAVDRQGNQSPPSNEVEVVTGD